MKPEPQRLRSYRSDKYCDAGDAMKAVGTDFHSALLPMLSHIEQDGNLLTGQNPRSSEAIAKAMVSALEKIPTKA